MASVSLPPATPPPSLHQPGGFNLLPFLPLPYPSVCRGGVSLPRYLMGRSWRATSPLCSGVHRCWGVLDIVGLPSVSNLFLGTRRKRAPTPLSLARVSGSRAGEPDSPRVTEEADDTELGGPPSSMPGLGACEESRRLCGGVAETFSRADPLVITVRSW